MMERSSTQSDSCAAGEGCVGTKYAPTVSRADRADARGADPDIFSRFLRRGACVAGLRLNISHTSQSHIRHRRSGAAVCGAIHGSASRVRVHTKQRRCMSEHPRMAHKGPARQRAAHSALRLARALRARIMPWSVHCALRRSPPYVRTSFLPPCAEVSFTSARGRSS